MQKENTLILELCKFIDYDKAKIEELMKGSVHWSYVLGQLMFHRMGAAAFYTIKECELLGKVNREFRNSLKMAYDIGKVKSESLKSALTMLYDIIGNADFPYALLKGAYLVSVYPNGLRTSNDLDILMNQKDLSKMEALLKSVGFTQGNIRNFKFTPATRGEILHSRMNRGETIPFVKPINLPDMEWLEIDINFSLDYKAKQENDTVNDLLQDVKPLIKTEKEPLFTLSPSDFMIHLCCHLYKEAAVYAWVEMERDLSIYKFADIYLLLNQWTDSEFYTDLTARIKKHGLNRECYYALLRTKEVFSIENLMLNKLLSDIRPDNTDYLTEIIRPDKNIKYRYDEDFTDWLFTSGRKEHLHEVTNV